MSNRNDDSRKLWWYKVAARLTGFLVSAFFLSFIMGDGVPDLMEGKGQHLYPVILMLMVAVAGYLVAWARPWGGGLLLLTSAVLLFVNFMMKGDLMMAVVYSVPFAVTGLLFLLQVKMFNRLKQKK